MIAVIGSINLDLIANVGRLPAAGETVSGSRFDTAPGGKGANQALAARRAGADVRMIGAVGRDSFAADALALLRDGGIDLSDVREVDGSTGTALILVGGDGENMIAVIPGANGALAADGLSASMLSGCGHVMLQNEVPPATVGRALAVAREAGAVSMLNIAPFDECLASCMTEADIVVANETEFDLACASLDLATGERSRRIRDWAARTGKTVVVTLGGDGVMAATPDAFHQVAAPRIVPVDTVGAGDTFCGYLGAGLEAGLPLEEALARAAKAGALACLKPGAQPSIPLAADVDAL